MDLNDLRTEADAEHLPVLIGLSDGTDERAGRGPGADDEGAGQVAQLMRCCAH